MSEVSREDAIEIIDTMRYCLDGDCENCDRECADATVWGKEAYTKAISDMEKLERIEQFMKGFDKGERNIITVQGAYSMIEQIVKGEK